MLFMHSGNRDNSPAWGLTFWVIFSFYFWIWICIALVSYFCVLMLIHSYRAQHYHHRELSATILTLSSYPILLIICWSITSVVDVTSTFSNPPKSVSGGFFTALGLILPSLQGFFHSTVFVVRNKIIYNSWKELIVNFKYENVCSTFSVWKEDVEGDGVLSVSPLHNFSTSSMSLTRHETMNGVHSNLKYDDDL